MQRVLHRGCPGGGVPRRRKCNCHPHFGVDLHRARLEGRRGVSVVGRRHLKRLRNSRIRVRPENVDCRQSGGGRSRSGDNYISGYSEHSRRGGSDEGGCTDVPALQCSVRRSIFCRDSVLDRLYIVVPRGQARARDLERARHTQKCGRNRVGDPHVSRVRYEDL